jgi:copper(I)-binding protein
MEHDMRLILTTALTAISILGATQALADPSTETVRDISIENASATVLVSGDVRLRFTLANDSPEAVIVTGVSSPLTQSGEIVGASHHGKAFPVSELILPPDEEMDFSTSHLEAQLLGVAERHDTVAFQLLLDDGSISREAHVH